MSQSKIAIIGGGPAGIAAAIQLRRYNQEPILFEPDLIGGLLHNARWVENYPGFPQGISGLELVDLFKRHLEPYKVDIRQEKVELLEYYDTINRLELRTSESSFSPDVVVVTTGTKPKKLNLVETFSEECQKKIFYDVYPIMFSENKRIAIIGAGDAAFDYALNLAAKNEVVIFNRTDKISALPSLIDPVKGSDKITYCENTELIRVEMTPEKQLGVMIGKFEEQWLMEADYLLLAIGREEQKDFYSEMLLKKEKELVEKEILYLAGDVNNGLCRQVSIAVGDGIKCAMQIYHNLKSEKI